ncbi:hypothetical protein SeMB42_g01282 [Synchytrium endobioticum]|uniref:RING-type domain-containing protein n=1 Tax=Synchytrium endobioticum TaxID=286115 RepID=A0A507DN40_9FUNG|nr:hypothetical protein SeMB42_g01282 [Synchytrium endobioticum]
MEDSYPVPTSSASAVNHILPARVSEDGASAVGSSPEMRSHTTGRSPLRPTVTSWPSDIRASMDSDRGDSLDYNISTTNLIKPDSVAVREHHPYAASATSITLDNNHPLTPNSTEPAPIPSHDYSIPIPPPLPPTPPPLPPPIPPPPPIVRTIRRPPVTGTASSGPTSNASSPATTFNNHNHDQFRDNSETTRGRPSRLVWMAWRVFLLLETLAFGSLLGIGGAALFADQNVNCDRRLYQLLQASVSLLVMQTSCGIALLFALPWESRWTWYNFRRIRISTIIWLFSIVVLVGQAIMIPIGFSFVKLASLECISVMSRTIDAVFVISLISSCAFMIISLPLCCVPCVFAFAEVPEYRGISPRALDRLETVNFPSSTAGNSNVTGNTATNSTSGLRGSRSSGSMSNGDATGTAPIDGVTVHSCAICLDTIAEGKRLPCGHIFHKNCLEGWFEEHRSCPYCRRSRKSSGSRLLSAANVFPQGPTSDLGCQQPSQLIRDASIACFQPSGNLEMADKVSYKFEDLDGVVGHSQASSSTSLPTTSIPAALPRSNSFIPSSARSPAAPTRSMWRANLSSYFSPRRLQRTSRSTSTSTMHTIAFWRRARDEENGRPTSRRLRLESRRMRENRMRASMMETSGAAPDKLTWIIARTVVCSEFIIFGSMVAACTWALSNDWGSVCDSRIYAFLAVDMAVLVSQMVLDACIASCAPRESLWTWENHRRAKAVSIMFDVKMLFIFTQGIMVLIGMGLIRSMGGACGTNTSLVPETTFWSCYAQLSLFMVVGLPAWCLPYLGILVEVPDVGGANPQILFKIKPVSLSSTDTNRDCSICLLEMDQSTKLPCGHVYHHDCLEQWWLERNDCPCCRKTFNNVSKWWKKMRQEPDTAFP